MFLRIVQRLRTYFTHLKTSKYRPHMAECGPLQITKLIEPTYSNVSITFPVTHASQFTL